MFATYLLPVTTAFLVFPIIALLVTLPVAFISYRRRGRAGGWTTVVLYAFIFYLLAAFMQTVIPLPRDPAVYCSTQTYASTPQLRPFYFIEVVEQRARGRWSLNAMVHNPALWTTVLNALLLTPLGFYLRYAVRMRALTTTLTAFGVSLFFELTQLTGLWFVYPCAYRLFSVDDLILNTAGALLGWLLAGPLGRLLPSIDADRDRRRYAARVTFTRRLFALITDVLGFAVLVGFCLGLLTLFGGPGAADDQGVAVAVLGVVWFLLVPALTGSTFGKRAMLLRVERTDGRRAGPLSLLVRNGILLSPGWLLLFGLSLDDWDLMQHPERIVIPVLLLAALFVVGVWSPLAVLLGDDHRAPYERVSRTVNAAIVRGPKPTAVISS